MSPKLPRLTADEAIRLIEKKGFKLARQSGSHKIYRNNEGVRITIPYHKGKTLHPKIISNILKSAEIEEKDLRET